MPILLQRTIPSSGEILPAIGIGTWKQFDVDSNSSSIPELKACMQGFIQSGYRLVDSSPMYGRSETTIGSLTAESGEPDRLFYATKVWTTGQEAGVRQIEDSFRKMKRATMDLLQVHNLVDMQSHFKTLNKLKEEGRVRYTGITHYLVSAHEELESLVRHEKFDFVQFNYNILTRNAERTLLPAAADHGKAVIINEPFEKGELFRKVRGISPPAWAIEAGMQNWSDFFLKFILSHPAVTCVIPATSDPAHLKMNLEAGDGDLPDEAMRRKMARFFAEL